MGREIGVLVDGKYGKEQKRRKTEERSAVVRQRTFYMSDRLIGLESGEEK